MPCMQTRGSPFPVLPAGNASPSLFVNKGTVDVSNNNLTFVILPNELYTFTTVTSGHKGAHTIPPATAFPIPYSDLFDTDAVPRPGRYWYDQMGAWAITATNDKSHGQVLQQITPDWPVCWGYSCAAPTTYFGDGSFQNVSFALDVELPAGTTLTLEAEPTSSSLSISTSGDWKFGGQSGSVSFPADSWHRVELARGTGWAAATFDGSVLANVSVSDASKTWRLKASLNQYVAANFDNLAVTSTE